MTREGRPPVACDALAVGYGDDPVVRDISFTVDDGSTTAILGRSGSGKTTLVRTLAGIIEPIGGQAVVLGSSLPDRPPPGQVGYIPQDLGLVPHRTAVNNVLHGALARLGPVQSLLGRFPENVRVDATDALDMVGLDGMADHRVRTLSGGQRRRVAIARALIQRPLLLLADEMLSELDEETATAIIDLITDLQERTGMTLVFVEHDRAVAERLANQLLRVDEGTIVVERSTAATRPVTRNPG